MKGYPTILAFTPGSKSPQQYQGERSAAALKAWALSLIPNKVATVNKQPQLQASISFDRASGLGQLPSVSAKSLKCLVCLGYLLRKGGLTRVSGRAVWSLSCSQKLHGGDLPPCVGLCCMPQILHATVRILEGMEAAL